MSKLTIEFEFESPHHELFTRLLAQEAGEGLCIEGYLDHLIFREMEAHPAFRQCVNLKCLALVWPDITMKAEPFAPCPTRRATVCAVPATRCPECGSSVDTTATVKRICAKADADKMAGRAKTA